MMLRDYATNQLIEELARRANSCEIRSPAHWCHDCAHFVAWLDKVPEPRKGCPEDYNPCTKGNVMKFKVPEGFDDEYGFFLPVCADRSLKPNA